MTKSTHCFEELTQAILRGEILPGEKLLCEELKKQYGVGMSPVREALSRLAATPLVTFEEHKGYTVKKMGAVELRDRIQSFAEIERLCLQDSIKHGDDAWESEIVGSLYRLKKAETLGEMAYVDWAPLNAHFHNALVSRCSLKTLKEIRDELYVSHQWVILLSYKFADSRAIKANHKEHEKIGEAAIARKSDLSCQLSFEHIVSSQDDLVKKLQAAGLIDA